MFQQPKYLEGHMFQEVGNPIVLLIFVSGSGVDPDSDGGGRGAVVFGSNF